MSRYLTSGRIALLALVELYAASRLPNRAVLPVVSFVVKHLVTSKDSTTFILTLGQIKEITVGQPSTVVGRTVFDLLLKRLWEINSFDALHSFFIEVSRCAVDTANLSKSEAAKNGENCIVGRKSILGTFIRRACLEYTRLEFRDAESLWCAFIDFREPSLSIWKKRNLGVGPLSFDMNLKGMTMVDPLFTKVYGRHNDHKNYFVSTEDIERLLEFQVDAMQKMGSRVPDDIQCQLKQILGTNVVIPTLSYYVEFLNSWRAGDYPASFDNLHRYFDYTMHNRDRTFYQYALLNLSILQADFGCYRESILAMQETINTARENRDMACLNFSLSWLYHFYKSHPGDCPDILASRMERDSLQFLKAKAKEGGMHHLQSMAHLSEAKQILFLGESIPAAFECLLRSSHLNVTKQIHNGIGPQMLLSSALWNRLGVAYLASTNCQIFLSKYQQNSPIEDKIKAICRWACILSIRGRHDDALEKLDQVGQQDLRSLKIYQYWAAYIGVIKLRRAVYRNELSAAETLLKHLSALPHIESDCALEISVARIEINIRSGNLTAALISSSEVLQSLVKEHADSYHRVRIMILRAQALAACGRSIKGISVAISAASLAWKARLMPALFHSIYTISHILIQLEQYMPAHAMMDSIMPQVLECEEAWLTGQCFACLADVQVGIAGTKMSAARSKCLLKALEFIDRAFTEFSRINDVSSQKQMISRKSKIQDFLGDKNLRDDTVKKYRQIQKEA
ncbi:anaphase-promoting complex subunit 5-domain-containing protein [Geopyxis carbonaria]|nr:anaphase-promoting complex subunit 5-domain-containing protein [Geopyxis carbonaria]